MEEKLLPAEEPAGAKSSRYQTKSVLSKTASFSDFTLESLGGRAGLCASERLKSNQLISQLFSEGKSVSSNGFTLVYFFSPLPTAFPAQVSFVAPKRVFKHAVDRNYAKRIMREVYRQQKTALYEWLMNQQKQAAIMCICKNKQPDLPTAQKALTTIFQKLTRA